MNNYIKDKEDAIKILKNLLNKNIFTKREKEAIKMGIIELQISIDNQ